MVSMKEFLVGLLFFGALVSLGILTIWLSDIPLFEAVYEYTVWFDQANELKVKNDVLIMGKRQGSVKSVKFHEEPLWSDRELCELWVSVQIKMDVPLTLKEDYRIRIRNTSILGGKVMDIRLGKSAKRIDTSDPELMLVGLAVRDPIEGISDFVESNKGYVRRTLENLDNLIANATEWSNRISQGEGTLGRLIYSESVANNVESLIANAERFMADLRSSEGTLDLLLRDPVTRNNVDKFVSDITLVSTNLAEGKGTVGKLLKEEELHDKIISVVDRLERMSASLEEGKGLAGKLFNEESEQAYEDLSRIMANAREISVEIRSGEGMLNTLVYDMEISDR
ncbi:MAG: MlaD family protein, partial [Planctomycetota bacterium]